MSILKCLSLVLLCKVGKIILIKRDFLKDKTVEAAACSVTLASYAQGMCALKRLTGALNLILKAMI